MCQGRYRCHAGHDELVGKITAYRASTDATQFVVIRLDKEKLGLTLDAPKTIDLASPPDGVSVNVDVYAQPVTEYPPYCNDVVVKNKASAEWTATAGTLIVEISADSRATMTLTNVTFTSPDGQTATAASITIDKVSFGWLPG